jgi:hypothetical protein
MLGIAILLVGGGILWFLSKRDDAPKGRTLWLMTGSRYSLLIWEPAAPDADSLQGMLMSMGFVVTRVAAQDLAAGTWQVDAYWNGQPTLWQVPENVSISEIA